MSFSSYHTPRKGVKLWRALRGVALLYLAALILTALLLVSRPSEAVLIQALILLAKVWEKVAEARR